MEVLKEAQRGHKKLKGEEDSTSGFDEKTQGAERKFFRIEAARKITQFCCFLLFNAAIFGLGPWPVLLPVLQSLGAPSKTVGDAFASLQLMLFRVVFPWLPLASFFVTAVFLGRALCGWACPFGFVQDILSYVKRKHREVSPRTHSSMVNVKYWILMIILFISVTLSISLATGMGEGYKRALGVFAPAPFNALSPADTLFAVLPRIFFNVRYAVSMLLGETVGEASGLFSVTPLFWVRIAILVGFLMLAVHVPRGWCRYFCPQGALMALLYRFGFLGLKRDLVKCTKVGCRECVEVCPMKVPILDLPWEKFTHPECIYCLKCVEVCSTKAIRPKFP